MKVRYDPKADILYILIKEGEVFDTDEVDEDVWIEYDENGRIMGIEIWNAGEKVIINALREIEKYTKTQKAKT
ncbi:hypothetical protein OCC_01639 [Thermococcus litoralis DSM 5473]|jgi:uncharacterized protein YuzE|uniref:DUF2283 domain-containing protein n=1 Tax=Thermococcus litoralis (strain ATCC 51850 / DSM 5473 / JCM 8560 / NS-C) TaxID=523849 RepID=H3ZLV9_THELN|nr:MULTISPECIES: DUF2283 domain-containing protein [Thermococcus]EHR79046.1 hypothetical protein OCC_01639 [Thermococcus litoralis DSM 5473]MPW39966.1 DUF2283 domain-containing protein [Thermococcus sp. 101 C5]